MAATGQEAVDMESISRAPPSALQFRPDTTGSGEDPGHGEARDSVARAPRKSTNNSKPAEECARARAS